MAVEEVIVRMGLDARPVSNALRGVRKDFQNFKDGLKTLNIGEIFTGLAAKIGIGLSVAGIGLMAKESIDLAKEIKNLSLATNASGSTLQAWALKVSKSGGDAESANKSIERLAAKIGEARSGSKEAVEAFEKLGISLKDANGNSLSTDAVLASLMDKVKSIKDPTLQLAAACDIFGEKMGGKVVNALREGSKAFEEFKKASSGKILSDAELDRLAEIGSLTKGAGKRASTLTGKALVIASTPFLGDAGTDLMLKNLRANMNPAGEVEDPEKKAEKAKDVAKALLQLDKARRDTEFDRLSTSKKVTFLRGEEWDLQQKLRAAEDGSVEQIELRVKIMEKDKEILEEQRKLEKEKLETQKKQTEEAEKKAKFLKHQTEKLHEINKLDHDLQRSQRQMAEKKADRTKFTLQELADAGRDQIARANELQSHSSNMVSAGLTPDQQAAINVQDLEARAKQVAMGGDQAGAQQLMSRADSIRAGIDGLKSDESTRTLHNIEDNTQQMSDQLEDLIEAAREDGIMIIPTMGK